MLQRLTALFLLSLALAPAPAFGLDVTQSVLVSERPSEHGEPTEVQIGVYVIDIDDIDDVRQRFSADLFFSVRWRDHRLALPETRRAGNKRLLALDQAWTPGVLILNGRELSPQLPERLEVDDMGNVRFQNRVTGELTANLEFRDFPFDVQRLPIDIVSYEYTTDDLLFSHDSEFIAPTTEFSLDGWHLEPIQPEVGVFTAPGHGIELPLLTYAVSAVRDSNYYVLTMLVPMSLIIFMAWTVFWLQPNMVPPRIAISTASIFSLLALGVSIRLGLPKVSYLTKADVFVLGCTLMIFLALGVAVIGSRWANSDRMDKALKANAIARWLYLLLFVVVALVALNL